ncbi:MAG: hypothetical protein ABJF23_25210 [Bryobacteraceae bacterium]
MNESAAKHHCICEDIAHIMRSFGPSESVVEHFRTARIEVLKGIRQMIDDRIERAQEKSAKGTSFGVE